MNYSLLAALPLVLLLIISLTKGVKPAIYIALIVTAILYFVWDSSVNAFFASFLAAAVDTLSILLIVFGAIFLYHTMEEKGFLRDIQQSLENIHPDRDFRFYFLAIFLTAFFESVAGFGTPGAIVPLLLVTMGYSAVTSIATVLLIDGLFAISGAVGTPVNIGLVKPLNLQADTVSQIYLLAAIAIFFAAVVIFIYVGLFAAKESETSKKHLVRLFLCIMLPLVGLSYFLEDLTGLIASAVMAMLSYFLLFKDRKIDLRPWIPYGLLVLILLLPKIFLPLADVLAADLRFESILATDIDASLQPLRSPFIPFLIVSVIAAYMAGDFTFSVAPVVKKVLNVFLILFPSLAITRLMLTSGSEIPSMVETLAAVFVQTGSAYPVLSPFIGVLGAFMTGSTTVSNVIFGPVQFSTADILGVEAAYILSLQLAGASLGNAVCLFNIIAAAAVAGVDNYSAILRKNLLPVFIATLLIGVLGFVLITYYQ
jgi:lactate permease